MTKAERLARLRATMKLLPATREQLAEQLGLKAGQVTSTMKALVKERWAQEGQGGLWDLTSVGRVELQVQGPKHAWLVGAECGDCPLRSGCRAVHPHYPDVGGRRVLFVGEAPAHDEERAELAGRQPAVFVGQSGKLLDKMLKEIGLRRSQVATTNAVACATYSGVPNDAIVACRGRLEHEVAQWRPDLIVALGRSAAASLLGGAVNLGQAHGRMMVAPEQFNNLPVLVTYHPAAILRNERLYATWKIDMAQVTKPHEVKVAEHFDVEIVDRPELPWGKPVAVDIETDGLEVGAHIASVAFAYEDHRAQVVMHPDARSFEGLQAQWIYHNGMFDVPRLRYAGWKSARCDDDTLLMAHAVDERGDHRLEYLSMVLLGSADWKGIAKGEDAAGKYQPAGLADQDLAHLNGVDACNTLRLVPVLRKQMAAEGTTRAYDLMLGAMDSLMAMQAYGMLLDADELQRIDVELSERLEQRHAQLRLLADAVGPADWRRMEGRYNYNAPVAMTALFGGLHLLPRGKGTDAKTLAGIVAKGEEPGATLAKLLLDCRHTYKLLSTYVRKLPGMAWADGRIHTVYKVHGTATGRLSSGDRMLKAPNLQNVAGDLKRAIIAPKGRRIANVDLSQAEINTLAHFAQDPALNAMLEAEADSHKAMAAIIYGVPLEQVTPLQRKHGKTINFGILYGRGDNAIAQELGVSVLEARSIINQYYARLPRVKQWKTEVEEQALARGYVEYSVGRRRHFAGLKEDEIRRESVNTIIQGTASDIVLASLPRIHKAFQQVPGVNLLATVHDSVMLEAQQEMAAAAGEVVRHIMTTVPADVLGMKVPFRADVEIGERWGH